MELSRRAVLRATGTVGLTGTLASVGAARRDRDERAARRTSRAQHAFAAGTQQAVTAGIGTPPYTLGQLTDHGRNRVDEAVDLVPLAEGGHVIVGQSLDTSGRDIWLVRVEPDGSERWDRTYGPPGPEHARAGAQDVSGDIVVAGTRDVNRRHPEMLFVRASPDGNTVVHESHSLAGVAGATDIAPAADGTYRLVGWTTPRAGTSISPAVYRVRPDGRPVSWRAFDGPFAGAFSSVVPVPGDGALAVGWSRPNEGGLRTVFVVRLNRDDTERWRTTKEIPGDADVNAAARHPDGGFVVGGTIDGDEPPIAWLLQLRDLGISGWGTAVPEQGVRLRRLLVTPGGDILFGGLSNSSSSSAWVGQATANGDVRWTGTFGPPELATVRGLDFQREQGLVVVGNTLFVENGQDAYRMTLERRNLPPQAFISVQPERAVVGSRVRFDPGASSDPDGEVVKYVWDLDDDGEFETEGEVVHKRFTEPGEKRVRLRVIDDGGRRGVARATVTILGEDENLTVTDPADKSGDVEITVPEFGLAGALAGAAGVAAFRLARARRRQRD